MSKLLLLSHADLSKEFYNAIHLIMGKPDDRVDFPKNWYKNIGFKPTHWNEYSCKLDEINLQN